MELQDDVPYSVDELSAEWLSRGLQASGLIDGCRVVDFALEALGDQVGFNGEVALITPSYTPPTAAAPASLVLKIPAATKNRIQGQTLGLYEKEIRFYRDLQPQLNIRTPRHYYSALDAADDPDVILERLLGMNRLPLWMIRGLMAAASWFVGGHPRHYALLIEDLSGYRMGDQAAGCSGADMEAVVSTLARLHSQFWASELLPTMSWIAPYSATSRIIQMMFLQGADRYLKNGDGGGIGELTPDRRALIGWLHRNGIALTETLGREPATLLHGDVRLDNICFDDERGDVVLFDWQTMLAGPGASDLAYFISATVPAEAAEDRVEALIDLYYRELTDSGVELSRERLRWQYELGMLTMLHRLLPTLYSDRMDLGSERGLSLLQAWVARIYARLEAVDYEGILERAPQAP